MIFVGLIINRLQDVPAQAPDLISFKIYPNDTSEITTLAKSQIIE